MSPEVKNVNLRAELWLVGTAVGPGTGLWVSGQKYWVSEQSCGSRTWLRVPEQDCGSQAWLFSRGKAVGPGAGVWVPGQGCGYRGGINQSLRRKSMTLLTSSHGAAHGPTRVGAPGPRVRRGDARHKDSSHTFPQVKAALATPRVGNSVVQRR